MKNPIILLVILAVIGAIGVHMAQKQKDAPPTPTFPNPDAEVVETADNALLFSKPWTWVETTYNNDTTVTPTQSDAFVATFSPDGTFSATTDCNAMSGSFEIVGTMINFGPIAMTKKFCPDSQEQVFAKLFTDEILSFFFTEDDMLVFDLKFDSGSAIFK